MSCSFHCFFWDGSSEAQRRYAHPFQRLNDLTLLLRQQAHGSLAPAADVMSSFAFPRMYVRDVNTHDRPLSAHVVLFPADSGFSSTMAAPSLSLTNFGHPRPLLPPAVHGVLQLFSDLLPGTPQPDFFSAPDLWDSAPFSLPQSPRQLSMQ
jgi:hypothetical protein